MLLGLVTAVLGLAGVVIREQRRMLSELTSRYAQDRILDVTCAVELSDFDEPEFHDRAEHELFARIGELFAGRPVLLISHRFSTVRSADRIYVLHDGRLVESGTHAELVALGGTYAELFTLQASPYQ